MILVTLNPDHDVIVGKDHSLRQFQLCGFK